MTPRRALRPRASDPRVLDRAHLDGTAELVCRARARHVDGVLQGGGLDDQAAGHQVLRLGVGAVGDHALVAPDRGPRVVERGSDVAPALPGQLIGPAIPLLDVSLKLRGRQTVPRDSAPTKDQHELAPQGTFLASRFRHHGLHRMPPHRTPAGGREAAGRPGRGYSLASALFPAAYRSMAPNPCCMTAELMAGTSANLARRRIPACGSAMNRTAMCVRPAPAGLSAHCAVPRKSPSKYSRTSRRSGSNAVTRPEKRTVAHRWASPPPLMMISTIAPISVGGRVPRCRIRSCGCHHWLRPAASSSSAWTISAGAAAMVASSTTSYM